MRIDKYQLIFWDFDGVIKDSIDIKTKAFVHLFDGCSPEVKNKIKNHHLAHGGMSRFDKIPLYLSWTKQEVTEEKINQFCNRFSQLVLEGVVESDWVPGSESYLKLNSHNQCFILVSATPQEELERILEKIQLEKCFSYVFGSPKNKKNAISEALNSTNTDRNECLMIGDAQADIDAAIANGVPFLLRMHVDNELLFSNYKGETIKDFREYE